MRSSIKSESLDEEEKKALYINQRAILFPDMVQGALTLESKLEQTVYDSSSDISIERAT